MESFNDTLRPLSPDRFTIVEAWHLLTRAGFGGTMEQARFLQKLGLNKAVDYLVDYQQVVDEPFAKPDYDVTIIRPPTREEMAATREARKNNDKVALAKMDLDRNARQAQDRSQMRDLQDWWMDLMIRTPRPLEEKLTLMWHCHFATNYRTVRDSAMMVQQNFFFRQNAAGNFATLLRGIIREPAMLRFLNNDQNNKEKPNENLAREIMELFSMGVGNYSETDIKEGARALTGYSRNDKTFVFNQGRHDSGMKTIFGKPSNYDGDGFVSAILSQPACPRFVARRLVHWFAVDPDAVGASENGRVIEALSQDLLKNGYELRPTLKTLFKSTFFYSSAVMGYQVKSPVQLIVQTVRSLQTPTRDTRVLNSASELMGQELFEPPSVAGWDTGRPWINSATMFARQNLVVFLVTGKMPYNDGWDRTEINYSPTRAVLGDVDPGNRQAAVDRLLFVMLGPRSTPRRKEELMAFLSQRPGPLTDDIVIGLMLIIGAMPEYQLC